MSLEEYALAQQQNFDAIKDSPHYSRLLATVDHLYHTTVAVSPAHCPRVCFGKMLLMCHKSMLSAATLIARGQVDDASLVTRRAIEIGHLAVAVHLDSRNYLKWLDYDRRYARWQQRLKGQRPKSEPTHKWSKDILEHPLLVELRAVLGILSDAYAHFTPEFEGNLQWTDDTHSDQHPEIRLDDFDTTKRAIHRAFLNLAVVHLKLLDVFNACFKNGLQGDGGWRLLQTTAWCIGN
jgi:hypothetical protein